MPDNIEKILDFISKTEVKEIQDIQDIEYILSFIEQLRVRDRSLAFIWS